MRSVILRLPLLLMTWLPAEALADVGPTPSCPRGTYHTYLRGHRCVRNGYHLESDDKHDVNEVPDGTLVGPEQPPRQPGKPSASCAMGRQSGAPYPMLGLTALCALGLVLTARRRRQAR